MVVPFFGIIVDKWGYRVSWLLLCSVLIGIAHFVMGLTMLTPVVGMTALGLGYAIYGVVLWPSIATAIQYKERQIIEEHSFRNSLATPEPVKLLGTGYGISMAALNTALTIIPFLSAQVRLATKSFIGVEIFYASLGIVFKLM